MSIRSPGGALRDRGAVRLQARHKTPAHTDSCYCLQVFLVFGKSGWIGGLIGGMLKEKGLKFEYANARLEDRAGILADIEHVKPTHILNAAGLTGRPNVDWCEDHKVSTWPTVSRLYERWH